MKTTDIAIKILLAVLIIAYLISCKKNPDAINSPALPDITKAINYPDLEIHYKMDEMGNAGEIKLISKNTGWDKNSSD